MKHIPTALSYRLYNLVPPGLTGDASVRTYLTDRDLFNCSAPESYSLDKIQQFALTDLLLFTTKIALALDRDNGSLNPVFQLKIAQDLLTPEIFQRYKTINEIQGYFAKNKQRSFEIAPLVTSLHTLNFLKRAIIAHEDQGIRPVHLTDSPGSHQAAFKLLLRLGNLLGNSQTATSTTGEVIAELIRSSMFFHREAPDVLIGRTYRMFFQLPNLHPPSGSTLQSMATLFENATKVSLENYFSLGVGLLTKFAQASLLRYDSAETPDPNAHTILHWPSWLSTVKINATQIAAMRSICCATLDDVRTGFRTSNPNVAFEYDLLPFINKPLLEVMPDTYILSYFPFLAEKFTSGIYWHIFDSLKGAEKGDFQRYWGALCQKYVEGIFETDIIPFSRKKLPFYDFPYQSGGSNSDASDIIIFDKQSSELFLFEVTYSALRLEASFRRDNLNAFSDGIEKIVGKIKQLDAVIKHLRDGTLVLPGVNRSAIRRFRPFVVTMTAYPIWNFVWQSHPPEWKGLLERIGQKQLLQSPDISSVKVINAREIEILGALQRSRVDVFQRLREWPNDLRWTNEPLQNFLIDRQRVKKGDFTTLRNQYLEATDMARELLLSIP